MSTQTLIKSQAETERLKTAGEYQHLSQEKNGAVQVTTNIRRELKKAFPGIKFSVKKRSCNAVTVKWTDGVTEARVKAITDKYRDSYFDGMKDLSVSCCSSFNAVYGGVGFIFMERKYSDKMKEMAINAFRNKFGHAFQDEDITLARFNTGELWLIGNDFFPTGGVQGRIKSILWEME